MKRFFTLSVLVILFSSLEIDAQQASNIQISPVSGQPTQMRLDWTAAGSGHNVLVVIRNSSSSYIPSLGLNPATAVVGTAFPGSDGGAGDIDGNSGGKIAAAIYNGNGTTVTVTGLSGGSQYTVKVYEYTGTGTSAVFNQAGASGNAIDFTYYSSSSAWMAPATVSNNATIYAWGGGGGSGNQVGGTAAEAGGGGGGFTSGIPSPTVSAGTSYTVTVGGGGPTGNSSGGSVGGASKFSNNGNTVDYIVANGGGGGATSGSGSAAVAGGVGGAASTTGSVHNKGGDGGDRMAGGGGGGGGGSAGAGGNGGGQPGTSPSGNTGGAAGSAGIGLGGPNVDPGAAGGAGGNNAPSTGGVDGNFPGGGGGGEGNGASSNGNGAGGLVIVAYTGTAPTVAIGSPSLSITNSSNTVSYTVTYTGASTINLTTANVTLNTTGSANGTIGITNGTTSPATVTISGITGNGTLGITITGGSSSDALLTADAGTSASTTFGVDNLPPVFSATAPTASSFVNNTKVSYTLSEAIASGSITWNLVSGTDASAPHVQALSSGAELATGVHTNFILSNNPTLVDGAKYDVVFNGTDAAGNAASPVTDAGVTYDFTAPGALTNAPVKNPAGSYINSSEATSGFTIRVDLTGSGAANNDKVRLLLGGSDFSTPILKTLTSTDITNTYADVTVPAGETWGAQGSKSITARVEDQAGNIGAVSPVLTLTLDTVAPTFSATAPTASSFVNNTNVSYTLSEAIASGSITWNLVSGTDVSAPHVQAFSGTELATGAHTNFTLSNNPTLVDGAKYDVVFNGTDAAGNAASPVTDAGVTYDFTAPGALTNAPVKNPAGIYINSSEATSGFTIRVDLTGSGAANNDKVRLLLGGSDFSTPILKTLTATDISNTYADVTVPAGETWGAQGGKSITARVEDQAGNIGAVSPVLTLTLDTVAPSFSATAPTSNSYVNNTIVSYTLSEAIASGTITWTRTGGTADATHTQALSGGAGELTTGVHGNITLSNNPTLVNGSIYKIDFNGTDLAGNNSVTVTSTTVEFDNAAPATPAAYTAVTTVGTIVANYWNGTNVGGTNAGVNLVVNIPNDVTLTNGTVEVEARISSGSFAAITTFTSSTIASVNTTKTITIDDSQIALIAGYGEGVSLQFHVRFHDRAGNISSYTQTTNSLFVDTVAPTISSTLFHANSSSRETIDFTFSETLDLTSGLPISTTTNGNPGFYSNPAQIQASGSTLFTASGLTLQDNSNGNWTAAVQITYTNSGSNSLASKYVRDVAGNELATVGPFTPGASPPQLASSMVLDPNNGANETISFTVDQNLNLANNATVTGLSVNATSFSGVYTLATNTITLTAALGTWTGTALISYNSGTGNIAGASGVGMLTFSNEPILLNPLSIASNNATNTSYAKVGDVVTLSFTANRALSATPAVTIDGVSATVSGANPYTASITTTGTNTTGVLTWTITATETSRSTTIVKTNDGSTVTFDKTPPTVTVASIISNNSTNTSYSKSGDIVTVNFTVSEALSALPTATIGGKTATVSNVSGLNYKASVTTDNTYTNGGLAINIGISDLAGNTGTKNATTDLSAVTFDNVPPIVSSIAIASPTLDGIIGNTHGIVATSVDFLVTFTETNTPLSGIDKTDFTIISDGTVGYSVLTNASITGSGNTRTVTISGISGTGRISLGLTDDNSIIDLAGNPLDGAADGSIAASYTGNQYYNIVLPEPGAQAYDTHLQTTSITSNSISLQWGVTSTPLPTAYLVMIAPHGSSFPATPADGGFVSANGTTIQIVTRTGNTDVATFSGLSSGTSYDFIVYKYALSPNNSSDNVNYELTTATVANGGEILIGAATTTASVSWITDVTPASPTISSINDNISNSATVLSFKIYDDGLNPISPNVMSFNDNGLAPETITFTLTEQLTNAAGPLSGFSASGTGVIPNANAVYSGSATNTITLTSPADGAWNSGTTISYSATTGTAQFVTLGKMQSIANHVLNSVSVFSKTPGTSTFTVPLGVTSIQVEVWGGGGSGGEYSIAYPTNGSSGGGGGGGYSRSLLSVTPGTVYNYTVGAGGSFRVEAACCAFGNNGSTTSFGGSLVQAEGGWAGLPSAYYGVYGATDADPPYTYGGRSSVGIGDFKRDGGQGGFGQTGISLSGGGGGSSAGNAIAGTGGTLGSGAATSAGGTAPTGGGNGGTGSASGSGGAGLPPGGGGGGVGGAFNSGAGADGQIKITYSNPIVTGTSDWALDDAPFKFNKLVITQATANNSPNPYNDWTQLIEGAELTDGTKTFNSVLNPADVQIHATDITFTNLPSAVSTDIGYITDANGSTSSKTYTLNIWLKTASSTVPMNPALAALIDGKDLAFKLDATLATNLGYNDGTTISSRLASPEPNFKTVPEPIQVLATELDFSTSPDLSQLVLTNITATSSVPDNVTFPEVRARDKNGNTDLGFNASGAGGIALSSAVGSLPTPVPMVSGVASLSGVQYQDAGNGTLTASTSTTNAIGGALTSGVSSIVPSPTSVTYSQGTIISTTIAPAFVSSLATTGAGTAVFDFTVTDDNGVAAGTDGAPTLIDHFVITKGVGNTVTNWNDAIASASLSIYDGVTTTSIAGIFNATSITFSNLLSSTPVSTDYGYVKDNKFKTFTLYVVLRSPMDNSTEELDDKQFVFDVDQTLGIPSISLNSKGSAFAASQKASSVAGNDIIQVKATQLDFITQWAAGTHQYYDATLSPIPQALARDVNGNLDVDWNTAPVLPTLTASANAPRTYPLDTSPTGGTLVTLSNGVFTFDPSLRATSGGNGQLGDPTHLILTSGALTSPVSPALGKANSFILDYDNKSDIIRETTFTYPTNIPYSIAANQVTNIGAATGVQMDRYTIRDGGGASDLDGTATKLSSITIRVNNYQYLQRIALYEVGPSPFSLNNEIIEIDATSASPNITIVTAPDVNNIGGIADYTFTGITSFSATDNGSNNFVIKCSFLPTVVDNQAISFQIRSVAASSSSSIFANPTPTSVQSAPFASYENQIEVVAQQIVYTTISPNASLNVPFPVVVQAQDANGNLDLDYNGPVQTFSADQTNGTFITANDPVAGNLFAAGVLSFQYNPGPPPPATGFQFTTGNGNTFLTLVSGLGTTVGSTNNTVAISGSSPTISILTSFDSWMYFDPTFGYTSEIDFVPFQNGSTSSASQALGQVILSDGGAPGSTVNPSGIKNLPLGSHDDLDGAFTQINDFTISLTSYQDINYIGLYTVGGVRIGGDYTPTVTGTVTFSGLNNISYQAPDNDVIKFIIRAEFKSTIVDQHQITMQITNVSPIAGSKFPENNFPAAATIGGVAGGDVSPSTQNFLDVIATSIDFTTQPGPGINPNIYAGINEPIGTNPVTGQPYSYGSVNPATFTQMPITTAGKVTARDKYANVDTGFSPTSLVIQDASGNNLGAPNNFTFGAGTGVMDLTGMSYPVAVGNQGAVKIIATATSPTRTIDSSVPSGGLGNSKPCDQVNVLDVSVTQDITGVAQGTGNPPTLALKGGLQGIRIFGLRFTANSTAGAEPLLKSFIIGFKDLLGASKPFEGSSLGTIFQNFHVLDGSGSDITSATSVVKQSSTNTPNVYDQILVTLPSPQSVTLSGISYFLIVDVNSNTNTATKEIIPYFTDSGYGNTDDQNTVVSNGTATGAFDGNVYTFASTKAPTLEADLKKYPTTVTSPYLGQPNVDPNISQIVLQFDTKVASLDGGGSGNLELWNRDFNTRVADLTLNASQTKGVVGGQTITSALYSSLIFDITNRVTPSLSADSVYFVKIVQGSYDPTINPPVGLGHGISDYSLNFYGGIADNSTMYFKISSAKAINLLGAKSPFNTTTLGTLNTSFDQLGKAYYIIVKSGDVNSPAPTIAEIMGASNYSTNHPLSTVGASGNFQITSVGDPSPTLAPANQIYQTNTFSSDFVTTNDYDVYLFAQNDAVPNPVLALGLYPKFTILGSTISASQSSNTPTNNIPTTSLLYKLCPNSAVTISSPMIIGETGAIPFSANYIQDFNVLLPTGFEFDVSVAPNVQLIGSNFQNLISYNNSLTSYSYSTSIGNGTGKITSATNSTSITGVGTAFLTEVSVGDALESGSSIGIVASVIDATHLTLVSNASTAVGSVSFKIRKHPAWEYNYISNTLLNIRFFNQSVPSNTPDFIALSGMSIIGGNSQQSPQGTIQWFFGNNVFTTANKSTFPLASISVNTVNPSNPDFNNTYWVLNQPFPSPDAVVQGPVYSAFSKTVNAIPDNFNDPTNPGSVRLLPSSGFAAGDYLASLFSGNGVSGDLLTLNAVTPGASFFINMDHTDLNGCITQRQEQYVVYDHNSQISKKLGQTVNVTSPVSPAGTKQDIVNSNFPIGAADPIISPLLGPSELAGYTLLQLTVDLPAASILPNPKIPISGPDWQSLIQNSIVTMGTNPGPPPTNFWSWDYSNILNASHAIPNPLTSGLTDVYDYFKSGIASGVAAPSSGNNYWIGGSLGKIQYTGAYQSTADNSVYVPFRQEVELFVPAVPLIEITGGTAFYDSLDVATAPNFNPTQYPPTSKHSNNGSDYRGTATFCEFGGAITVTGLPLANAGTSTGTFALFDYSQFDFTKSPSINAAINPPSVVPTSAGFVDNKNGTASIDPAIIKNGYNNILVTYTYQDNNSPAIGTGYLIIRITPNPIANFTQTSTGPNASSLSAFCVNNQIVFDASSSTINGVAIGNSATYVWGFGDPNSPTNSSTLSNPSHSFSVSTTYNVTLDLISDFGCHSVPFTNAQGIIPGSKTIAVPVGDIPTVDFSFAGNCIDVPMTFKDNSSTPGGSNSSTYQFNWYYDFANNPGAVFTGYNLAQTVKPPVTNVDGQNVSNNYSVPGFYAVKLTTITTLGCQNSKSTPISQLDVRQPFNQYFDSDDGGWQTIDLATYTPGPGDAQVSWTWGSVSGRTNSVFDSPAGNKMWATSATPNANTGFYNPKEKSALYSACLNLDSTIVPRPMISYSSFVDVSTGDGLVLQYSIDNLNILDPTKVWTNLGEIGSGLDWYTNVGLPSNPGSNTSNAAGIGWSGNPVILEGKKWIHPKHKLDKLSPNTQKLILRFALSSVASSTVLSNSVTPYDGIAIDSVFFGSRTRTILFENFTTTDDGGVASTSDLKTDADAISAFVQQNISGTQLVNINYHIGFIGLDPFNLDNPADPSSRALYYNVNKVPYAFLDGTHYRDSTKTPPSDLFKDWGQNEYDLNTLELAKADFLDSISVGSKPTKVKSNPDGSLQVDVNFTPEFDLPFGVRGGTVLQVAILEKQINGVPTYGKVTTGETSFGYVLKKMLPDAAGTKFLSAITAGVPVSVPSFTWIPKNLHSNLLTVVVFLQNEDTKEVYQAFIKDNIPVPPPATAIEPIAADNIKVYPNPSDQEFTIELPAPAQQSMKVTMANQLGQFTEMGSFGEGELSKKISTQGLAEGVYILQLGSNGNALRTKVVVLHK